MLYKDKIISEFQLRLETLRRAQMTVLSRLASAVEDYRVLRTGAAILAGANAFTPTVAIAQDAPAEKAALASPAASKPIPQEHCNILWGSVASALKTGAGGPISPVTKGGLRNFFGRGDCSGDRQLAWANDKDFDFILGVRSFASEAAKVNFGKTYGVKPAKRPTAEPVTGQTSGAVPAPRG